jgi:hypothetical protein
MTETLLLCCSAIVAYWHDIFHWWACSHQHGLHRNHHSSSVVYGPLSSSHFIVLIVNLYSDSCFNITQPCTNVKMWFDQNHYLFKSKWAFLSSSNFCLILTIKFNVKRSESPKLFCKISKVAKSADMHFQTKHGLMKCNLISAEAGEQTWTRVNIKN